ncbi:MAG: DUF1311 domain-containing protein [Chitinophagaceae bacterium]|nr:MAG: DUF1311 domain-containing protein [Chitinophagaceae bacterium]
MKKLLFALAFFFQAAVSIGQTQAELNATALKEYREADRQLNAAYKAVLQRYKQDAVFIKNLKAAQLQWIRFRDAEMKMKYPDRPRGYYGSVQPMCWSAYITHLTQQRLQTLKQWIDGVAEGDACAGSVRVRP